MSKVILKIIYMKVLKIIILLFLHVMVLSCTENDLNLNNDYQLTKATDLLFQKVKKKYNIADIRLINEGHVVNYNDGKSLIIESLEGDKFLVTGSHLSQAGIVVEIDKLEGISKIITQNVNSSLLGYNNKIQDSPCNKHPEGESFKECFKREQDDFCDGFWSCLAVETQPIISVLIAIHCELCS